MHRGIEQSCHATYVLSAFFDFDNRDTTGWHVVALLGKVKLFEWLQFASGFQGQGLAKLRVDQSPQIEKPGLVDVRAD